VQQASVARRKRGARPGISGENSPEALACRQFAPISRARQAQDGKTRRRVNGGKWRLDRFGERNPMQASAR